MAAKKSEKHKPVKSLLKQETQWFTVTVIHVSSRKLINGNDCIGIIK